MEGDVNGLPVTQYCVIRRLQCTAKQERKHEQWFLRFPVSVDGIVYPRDGWRDPIKRSEKEQLPPWIPHEVAGTGWG